MKKKLLIALGMVLCAALLVVGSIAGTFAYLTSQDTVTNTFTYGQIAITLDEAKTDIYGAPVDAEGNKVDALEDAARSGDGNKYKLIPGHTYTKDPVIHVEAESEESYLFVQITNDIKAIEAAGNTIEAQMLANGWVALDGEDGVYYLDHTVNTIDREAIDVEIFAEFTIAEGATVSGYENAKIVITAYAAQVDGFTDAADAWENAFN